MRLNKPKVFIDALYKDLFEKYIEVILNNNGNVVKNGAFYNVDVDDYPYIVVKDGIRRTLHQPISSEKTIHMFGASFVYGAGAEDAHTISSFLQLLLNSYTGIKYIVHNYGTRGVNLENVYLQLLSTKLNTDDIVIIIHSKAAQSSEGMENYYINLYHVIREICKTNNCRLVLFIFPDIYSIVNPSLHELIVESHNTDQIDNNDIQENRFNRHPSIQTSLTIVHDLNSIGIETHDLTTLFHRPHNMGEVFIDPYHVTYKANNAIANYILKIITQSTGMSCYDFKGDMAETRDTVHRTCVSYISRNVNKFYLWKDKGIQQWIQTIQAKACFTGSSVQIGAIVMNANPFTNGHLYLVESALKEVDALYIFVVEENASFFPFQTRFELVRKGVANLEKPVHVLPSGRFIISSFSFPDYFTKETKQYDIDSSLDVLLFASIIAPELRIQHRFIGEEHNCRVTAEYNNNLLKFLPYLQIQVHVIPRIMHGDAVISASSVRCLLSDGKLEEIEKIVPPSTFNYLIDCYSHFCNSHRLEDVQTKLRCGFHLATNDDATFNDANIIVNEMYTINKDNHIDMQTFKDDTAFARSGIRLQFSVLTDFKENKSNSEKFLDYDIYGKYEGAEYGVRRLMSLAERHGMNLHFHCIASDDHEIQIANEICSEACARGHTGGIHSVGLRISSSGNIYFSPSLSAFSLDLHESGFLRNGASSCAQMLSDALSGFICTNQGEGTVTLWLRPWSLVLHSKETIVPDALAVACLDRIMGLIKTQGRSFVPTVGADSVPSVPDEANCPLCETPVTSFIEFNKIPGRCCPRCYAAERQRSFFHYYNSHADPLLDFSGKRCLIIGPSPAEYQFIARHTPLDLHTLDVRQIRDGQTYVADMCDMNQVPTSFYDFVYVSQVLTYVHSIDAAIKGVLRILAKDGIFLNTETILFNVKTTEIKDETIIASAYGKELYNKYGIGKNRSFGELDIQSILGKYFSITKQHRLFDIPTRKNVIWHFCMM
jgi:[citrate (pro-3S)-lyase] ligase